MFQQSEIIETSKTQRNDPLQKHFTFFCMRAEAQKGADKLISSYCGATTSTNTVQPGTVTIPAVENLPSVDQIEIDMPSIVQTANGKEPMQPTSPAPSLTASSDLRSVSQAVIQQIISECCQYGLHDQVQILSVLQKELLHGRKLDLTEHDSTCEGETNYICVNRDDILKTTFNELESLTDFCITLRLHGRNGK